MLPGLVEYPGTATIHAVLAPAGLPHSIGDGTVEGPVAFPHLHEKRLDAFPGIHITAAHRRPFGGLGGEAARLAPALR
jgi:hypothetical protein